MRNSPREWTAACFDGYGEGGDVEIIGRYALHGEIAAGGMARVFFGSLMGATGFSRLVAVKRLHPQFAGEEHVRAMFIDEARLAARVHHPNVVATLDVVHEPGPDGDGELLLVMEYVHGESLRVLVRNMNRRHLHVPVPIALSIMSNVLYGLHAVHEATAEDGVPLAIVHRDVSPSNILVGVDGAARVLDFGIARAERRLESTRTGTVKGKLAYMAPEQFSGQKVTRKTDIFAAGIVLWELLTGKRLFVRQDDGDNVLMEKILKSEVERPSQWRHELSPAIDAITMTALARDPADRFETAREMAVALEHAGQLATMSEVADWVRDAARESLAARTEIVRRAERDSASMRAARTSDTPIELSRADFLPPADAASIPAPRLDDVAPARSALSLLPRIEASVRMSLQDRAWARRGVLLGASIGVAAGAVMTFAARTRAPAPTVSETTVHAAIAARPSICPPEMRPIAGGRFSMGADDALPFERPAHPVTLSPYCMDAYEVTTADYKACSDRGDCKRAGITNRASDMRAEEHALYDPLCNAREPNERANHPINCVSFEMADIYCHAIGKRLPTEAEWELAAHGADGRRYPWGNDDPSAARLNACGLECLKWSRAAHAEDLRAMYIGDDGWATTAPVGSFPQGASPYGVEDLVGNVWEWVSDWYGDYATDEEIDPRGPPIGAERVIRGGAWNGALAAWARPTFRSKDVPDRRSYAVGFRCAKSQEPR